MRRRLNRHRTPRRLFSEGLYAPITSDPISLVNDINKSTVIGIVCYAKGSIIQHGKVTRPKAATFSSTAISIESGKFNVTITNISKVESWQSSEDAFDVITKDGLIFRISILKY